VEDAGDLGPQHGCVVPVGRFPVEHLHYRGPAGKHHLPADLEVSGQLAVLDAGAFREHRPALQLLGVGEAAVDPMHCPVDRQQRLRGGRPPGQPEQRAQGGPVVAENHGVRHAGDLPEEAFDPRGVDVLPVRGDQNLLLPPDDDQVSLIGDCPQVSGVEPPVVGHG